MVNGRTTNKYMYTFSIHTQKIVYSILRASEGLTNDYWGWNRANMYLNKSRTAAP